MAELFATLQHGFQGTIDRTRTASEPWWPEIRRAPHGTPNIVIVYMDDMGYADVGCFGSDIDTPHIDALAARGLRFNHYTTHPICSSARAALFTGRNAHAVSSGWVANNHAGFPGYSGEIPLHAPTIAETLRTQGYSTMMVGKWHNTPTYLSLPSSPKDSWPSQRGFDYFYGFMEGETNFFFPARLMLGNALLPIDAYPDDYYTTDDWTDKAIAFVREVRHSAPEQPFFLYVAHNAVHAPLQAKPTDIRKYRDRYDAGWDVLRQARYQRQLALGIMPPGATLAASDPSIPKWHQAAPADRRLYARHMEVYAAMLDCVDQNFGRLVAFLEAIGELDNTIIMFSSDNGGTSAGGPHGNFYNNRRNNGLPDRPLDRERELTELLGGPQSEALYPTGWGQLCNTPFPTYKTYTGGGGRRVSYILSWPAKITDMGGIRSQFIHVTDVLPTLLDLAGLQPLDTIHGAPALPQHGKSFAAVLFDATVPSSRTEQYYECWANRAYYRNGWLARSLQKRGAPVDLDNWTLHNLHEDFSESVDRREEHPEKLHELIEAFDQEAWINMVYPLDNRSMLQKMSDGITRGQLPGPRTFTPGGQTIHRGLIVPMISDRNFRIRVRFACKTGDHGVLWSIGEQIGGMVLYIEVGLLRFYYNGFGEHSTLPPVPLVPGEHEAVLDYEATGKREGRGRLLVDGTDPTDWGPLSPTLMVGFHEGLDIGLDRRCPVSWEIYQKHRVFRFTGSIQDVTIEPGERPGSAPGGNAG